MLWWVVIVCGWLQGGLVQFFMGFEIMCDSTDNHANWQNLGTHVTGTGLAGV